MAHDSGQTREEVERQLRGLQAVERIRAALEDRFEVEVREAVCSGVDYPPARLHDYLTGIEDSHEPRVRLLFELFERGALRRPELAAELADVPATCFFLGTAARYERSLADWLTLFGGTYTPPALTDRPGDLPRDLELWSAGDLVWSRSRQAAQDCADYLTLLLDRPVGLWRMRIPVSALRCVAHDRWSGRDDTRYLVPPQVLDISRATQLAPGAPAPLDRPLAPRPRIVDEL
ncbi:hypothetical protein BJY21_002075 [Kineosphaera limosa]|uniref:Uncharacterized protein n=1 Tax=Kineosphaera limosa NBRC 100340 TaxID=1184609 RepID=K6VFF3_9MICO|nr:hypothetical protein [Kineosphaera limosa]NYE00891.1 hypothetical protein [Kineosphaera limosa]GAB94913.1 hypothetical protein KILIM_014_00490 [Kineosphaera limosa NBRC 100340]